MYVKTLSQYLGPWGPSKKWLAIITFIIIHEDKWLNDWDFLGLGEIYHELAEFTACLEIFVSIVLETCMWKQSFLPPFVHPWLRMYTAFNTFLQFILNTTARGILLNQKLELALFCGQPSPLPISIKRKTRASINGLQVLWDLACWSLFCIIPDGRFIYPGTQIFILCLGHVRNTLTSGPLHLLVPPTGNRSPSYLHGSFPHILQIFTGMFPSYLSLTLQSTPTHTSSMLFISRLHVWHACSVLFICHCSVSCLFLLNRT